MLYHFGAHMPVISTLAHRKAHKRQWEMAIILDTLRPMLPRMDRPLRILEFGCGAGYQTLQLQSLGNVIATDVYTHPAVGSAMRFPFVQCSIDRAPFPTGFFDMIFSNHVIEHLPNLADAFSEMKRIAAPHCHLVFAVPTATWMALSIPSTYARKLAGILRRVTAPFRKTEACTAGARPGNTPRAITDRPSPWFAKLLPSGHGEYPRFLQAFLHFRVVQWKRTFEAHGLRIRSATPLLSYSSSYLPIVPPNRMLARAGLPSSMLFILALKDLS